jgi:hypothetical protein
MLPTKYRNVVKSQPLSSHLLLYHPSCTVELAKWVSYAPNSYCSPSTLFVRFVVSPSTTRFHVPCLMGDQFPLSIFVGYGLASLLDRKLVVDHS